MTLLPLIALLVPLQGTSLPARQPRSPEPRGGPGPNIVFVLADDFGVDMVGAYGEGADPPCTPVIDGLAAQGMLFRNAWVNPVCSPTRAAVLTGMYGFRTGIGGTLTNQDAGLALSEVTIPEMLSGYDSTCAGKWHLHGDQGNLHPNDTGFGHYAGSLRGALPDYSAWSKVTDGQVSQTTTYATTDTTDEAIAAIHGMQEPWFLYVSFNAIHAPFHEPEAAVCGRALCPHTWCDNLPANPTEVELAKAMTEAMDSAVGRILAELAVVDPEAYVVFMGDNGTPRSVSEDPFTAAHAKGSLYEGGVNVPLIVRGPGVAAAECDALVSGVDLFATFAELAHVRATADDSVSMVPYFTDPSLALRATVYAETFAPNGGPPAEHRRAVRNARYKLIRQTGEPDELYDLDVDGFETLDLFPNMNAAQQAAYDALVAELVALGVD